LIELLPVVIPAPPDRPELAGEDHPMRKVTRQVAFEPEGWTPERAEKVAELFNALAPEWHTRGSELRQEPLRDALARGGPFGPLCVEVGSGTGFGTRQLSASFERIVAIDLALEMLVRAPADVGHRVLADGAVLPIGTGRANAVVLVNALLFPKEVERVLAPGGALIWVNSLGDRTPIHLSAEDVEHALPGEWLGRASEAGWGTWCVLRRADGS
jgi:SAM-dependent methyltransferase